MIDLDVMPPDWKFAQQHAKAMRPGIAQSFYVRKGTNVYCQCCLKPVQKEPVPLTANSKQLQFLGFGFPLYFIYFKYSIILILVLACSYSGVSLYWAIVSNQNFCIHRLLSTANEGDPHCTSFLIIFSRIQQQLSGEEIILRISSFLLHLFTLIYIRDNIRKTYGYYDQRAKLLSHYSLVFKKLPLKNGIQHDIRQFINKHFIQQWLEYEQEFYNQHFNRQAQKVKQIILVPDLREYLKLEEEKKHFIQQKRKILKSQQKSQQFHSSQHNEYYPKTKSTIPEASSTNTEVSNVEQQIKKTKHKIKMMKKQLIQKAHVDQLKAQMAIVVLNTEIFKNTVLEFANDRENKLNKELLGEYFGQFSGDIKIVKAPQPNEIIWQNIHYSSHQRLIGKMIGWGLTVIFLAAVTVAFYFILVAKSNVLLDAIDQTLTPEQYHHSGSYYTAIFLVFLIMFLTVIFNKIVMSWALHHFTYFQKHDNTSDQEFSFCLKYTFGLFFTTALMTLAVEAITFHNFYTHQYGVIQQQSIMFFVNALFIPLFMLINPFQLKVLIVRRLNKGKRYFTQGQANKIMSDNPYVMGKQYAEIIQSLWFTFLYATILPMGAFIMVIGLGLYYWTSKYNMLRRSSLRHNISGEMALHCLKLLDLTLMMKPLGEIIFDASIRDGVDASSIVMLCLGVLYFFLPMSIILQFFHGQKFQHSKKTYDQVKSRFVETYETLHPIFNEHIMQVFRTVEKSLSKKISLTHISIPQAVDELIVQNPDEGLGSGVNLKNDQNEYYHSHYHSQHEIKEDNKFINGG